MHDGDATQGLSPGKHMLAAAEAGEDQFMLQFIFKSYMYW